MNLFQLYQQHLWLTDNKTKVQLFTLLFTTKFSLCPINLLFATLDHSRGTPTFFAQQAYSSETILVGGRWVV